MNHDGELPMQMLTVEDVSALLRVSKARAYELCRSGMLPSVRLGRQVRVPVHALRTWINRGGQPLPGVWRTDASDVSGQDIPLDEAETLTSPEPQLEAKEPRTVRQPRPAP